MIKTEEQLLYEEIRHIVSANYVVPKHLTEEMLVRVILTLSGKQAS